MNVVIEYVAPADTSTLEFLGMLGIGAGLLLLLLAMPILMSMDMQGWGTLTIFVSVTCVVLGIMGLSQPLAATDEARAAMVEQTNHLYPSLTEEQVQDIWYNVPSSKPDARFKVMSTIELPPEEGSGGAFTKREVSLVWNGEGYVLAQSADGEKFEPLER